MQKIKVPIADRQPVVMIAIDPNGRARMTRDMELIRKIIQEIQNRNDLRHSVMVIDGYDEAIVARHMELLMDSGLIEALKSDPIDAPYPTIMVKDLTWQGHDFAAVITNDTVWSKIKQSLTAKDLATLPLGILKNVGVGVLEQLAKSQLGL
jgi:hypothetical protein